MPIFFTRCFKVFIVVSAVLFGCVLIFPSEASAKTFNPSQWIQGTPNLDPFIPIRSLENVTTPTIVLAQAAVEAPEVTVEEEAKAEAKKAKELAKAEAKEAKKLAKAEAKKLKEAKEAEEELAEAEAKKIKDAEKAEAKKAKEFAKAEAKKAKELAKAEAKKLKEAEAEAKESTPDAA